MSAGAKSGQAGNSRGDLLREMRGQLVGSVVDQPCECRNLRLSEEVTLDLGPGELLVGIEILDAKRLVGNGQLPQLVVDHLPVEAA